MNDDKLQDGIYDRAVFAFSAVYGSAIHPTDDLPEGDHAPSRPTRRAVEHAGKDAPMPIPGKPPAWWPGYGRTSSPGWRSPSPSFTAVVTLAVSTGSAPTTAAAEPVAGDTPRRPQPTCHQHPEQFTNRKRRATAPSCQFRSCTRTSADSECRMTCMRCHSHASWVPFDRFSRGRTAPEPL